jgi:hypothetical protein
MKKLFSLLLVCVLLLPASSQTAQAATASKPSAQAAASIDEATELGLVTDEISKAYRTYTTRAEFCRLIANFLAVFYDVPIEELVAARELVPPVFKDADDYAVRALAALGIASGGANGKFLPA